MSQKPWVNVDSVNRGIDEIVKVGAETRAIAILRKCPEFALMNVVAALEQSGIRLVEITLDSSRPFDLIQKVIAEHPGLLVGAGTVHTAGDVKTVAEIGGRFIVSPIISEEVMLASSQRGLAVFPGAATPSEIIQASALGATAVKIFPAQQLGGPSFLKAVMSPLLNPRLIPTGGVDIHNAPRYIEAGAFAVGIGSALIKSELIESADFLKLEKLLKKFMKVIL